MDTIIFSFPGSRNISKQLKSKLSVQEGVFTLRQFPDGETYLRVQSSVVGKKIIIVCSLDRPDNKLLPLYFLAKTLKEQGAVHICLLAPYLAYMRQDKIFQPGEALTAKYFSALLSEFIDRLVTVDPHLHRISRLEEIYSIPTNVVHGAYPIANWIKANIPKAVLVGPDVESRQWVEEIATISSLPFVILEKVRKGDRDVHISVPAALDYEDHTPVLVDDIISTARTMIQTVSILLKAGMKAPVCIGVHAIFADDAYQELITTGVDKVVTCNTIEHVSNDIDLSDLYLSLF